MSLMGRQKYRLLTAILQRGFIFPFSLGAGRLCDPAIFAAATKSN
jgi:hypothetical protein